MSVSKPLFKKKNILYEREEKNGYWTFIPKFHAETGEIIINPTSREILSYCTGSLSLDEIVTTMKHHYKNIDERTLELDVNQTIAQFSRLGIIEWTHENPFLYLKEEPISKTIVLCIGQDYHLSAIHSFIKNRKKISRRNFINYYSPILNDDEYNELSLRKKLFTCMEEFFLLQKNQRIIGLISIELNSNSETNTSASLNMFIAPTQYAHHLLHYAQDTFPFLAVKNITKIKIVEHVQHPFPASLKKMIRQEHYLQEGLLRNEYGFGFDLRIFARSYKKKFIERTHKK